MSIISFLKLIQEELQANLDIAGKSGNIQMYRISLTLLWFGKGKSMLDIAKDIGVTVKIVFNWLKTFMYKGMGLLPFALRIRQSVTV
jgi:hypothetical protein